MYNNTNIDMETKVSFFGGSFLTVMMTSGIVEIGMALVLGVIGGVAGMAGKDLYYYIKRNINK
tara:strand:- start:207 stop:395 length:189 start_codon:yes stop_codon:yes gene_type:complete